MVNFMVHLGRDGNLKPVHVIIVLAILRQQTDPQCQQASLENLKRTLFEMSFLPGDTERVETAFREAFYELLITGAIDLLDGNCSINPESELGRRLTTLAKEHPLTKFMRSV